MATSGRFRIRRVREEDWEAAREQRLEMLQDTPIAYLERYDDALRHSEEVWRAQVRRDARGATSTRYVAETVEGVWVGTIGCFVDVPGRAMIVAVYVSPGWRGRDAGVADALLEEASRWARDEAGATELRLFVHEDNARARAYYQRVGFTDTGATMPYDLDPSRREIEMARDL